MKNRCTGFSSIELVVTMALAVIIVVIALPSMSGLEQGPRITAATNMFITSFQYSRSVATGKGTGTQVRMVANNPDDWAQGWTVVSGANDVLYTVPLVQGTVTMISKSGVYAFDSTGSASPADTVYVCDSSRTGETGRELTIELVGRVETNSNYKCDQ